MSVAKISAELQALQRQRAVLTKSRIMQSNRLQAIVAGAIGYQANMSEKDRQKKFAEASALIEECRDESFEHPMAAVVRTTLIGIDAFEAQQRVYEKEMLALAKKLPVAAWVAHKDRRGFGLLQLAIVVGECGDLANYPNPAKIWRRMGCAPHSFDGQTHMGATWRAGKEGKLPAAEWASFGYSPRRRSIAYLVGEGIVKQNDAGPYRTHYDQTKDAAQERHPDWPKLRCHRHAMLLATKRLLLDLWRTWNGRRPKPQVKPKLPRAA